MRPLALTEDFIKTKMEEFKLALMSAKFSTGKISYDITPDIKKLTGDERVQIHFESAAYYKMKELIDQCSDEIAWDGVVTRDAENPKIFYIEDVFMYPQTVTAATVDTDDEKYQLWLDSLDDETFNRRRFNGHSHVRMGVTPSATDMTYREESMRNVKDFFIFGIFNKNDAHNLVVYDVEHNILYENDDIVMYIPVPDYGDWAKEEIKKHLTKRSSTTTYGGYNGGRYENGKWVPGHAAATTPSTTTPATTTTKDDKKKSDSNVGSNAAVNTKGWDEDDYWEEYYREMGYID